MRLELKEASSASAENGHRPLRRPSADTVEAIGRVIPLGVRGEFSRNFSAGSPIPWTDRSCGLADGGVWPAARPIWPASESVQRTRAAILFAATKLSNCPISPRKPWRSGFNPRRFPNPAGNLPDGTIDVLLCSQKFPVSLRREFTLNPLHRLRFFYQTGGARAAGAKDSLYFPS